MVVRVLTGTTSATGCEGRVNSYTAIFNPDGRALPWSRNDRAVMLVQWSDSHGNLHRVHVV